MSKFFRVSSLLLLLIVGSFAARSQQLPERRIIRQGNRQFERENYVEADVAYRRALEKNPASYEANFNLSDAIYKQGQYEDAAAKFGQLATASPTPEASAAAYYNQGNAFFQQKKYQEAVDAYKNALRMNPGDEQAKFNYAYAKEFLKKDNDKNNQDNKDNKDNKDNQDNKNDQNKDDKKDNKDQNQDQDKNKQDQQQQQQPQSGMSKDEAQQMLNAIQKNEDNTREKVDAQKVQAASRSGKNW